MPITVRWGFEDRTAADGATHRVRVAWIVDAPAVDAADVGRPRYLAYLGDHPAVTAQLTEEFAALYPDLEVDWGAVRASIDNPPAPERMPLEELSLHWPDALEIYGLNYIEVDLRLGRGRRRPLAEIRTLLAEPATVARLERTAGSVIAYLVDFHPEYAYALAKLRLLLEGRDDELEQLESDEPLPGGGVPRAERVAFWRAAVETIRTEDA